MAAQGHFEGQSVNRPPLFDGEDYVYWKTRMEFLLQGLDYQIWSIVEGDLLVTNEKDKWTEDDKKKISLNCKAKSILCCALSKKEFNCISACKSAMEMWEKLRITYEGTDKVKETRIDNLESMRSSEDEEALLSRRLQRILAKKNKYQSERRYFKKNKDFKKIEGKDTKRAEPICYECKKPGHIKAECLKLKKTEIRKKDYSRKFRRYKKKVMAAAWDNSSNSDNAQLAAAPSAAD
ncbi:hypothetical protein Taro_010183 [Colocasia esculenta]|uniref:CCHC-type domain-containing protein n=1 Tax=Colocasia esculenta TaxID=4460 RepID=A0A843U6Y6_COLES|nr:hypothetical protein [Colocasia esculenta]